MLLPPSCLISTMTVRRHLTETRMIHKLTLSSCTRFDHVGGQHLSLRYDGRVQRQSIGPNARPASWTAGDSCNSGPRILLVGGRSNVWEYARLLVLHW